MPDWVTCSSCGLKHSARADGVCPRCRNAVDDATPPGAPAAAVRPYAPAPGAAATSTTKILLVVAAVGFLVLLFGAIAIRSLLGSNPLTRLALSAQTEGPAVNTVDGRNFRYRLSSPAKNWYFRRAALARKDNPLADIWLIQTSADAHVMVIAERVGDGQRVDMDRLAQIVIDNARKNAQRFTLVGQEPISNSRGFGRLLHTRARMDGLELEFYYGIFAREPQIYQVVAWTRAQQFATMAPELRAWVSSFETVAP